MAEIWGFFKMNENFKTCAQLADFGCSKQLQGMRTGTLEQSLQAIQGSVPWMAPEVIKQSGHGRSADVWSLGATVIEMATAHHPWPAFTNNLTVSKTQRRTYDSTRHTHTRREKRKKRTRARAQQHCSQRSRRANAHCGAAL